MSTTLATKTRRIAGFAALLVALVAATPMASAATRVPRSTGPAPTAIAAPSLTGAQERHAYRTLGLQRPPVVRGVPRRPTARLAAATPRHGAPYFAGCPTNLAAAYRNVLFNLTLSGPLQIDKWPGADTSTVYGHGDGQYTGGGNIYWQPLVWWLDGSRWQGPVAGEWMRYGAGGFGWDSWPVSGQGAFRYFIVTRGRYLVGQRIIWDGHADVSEYNYTVNCPG